MIKKHFFTAYIFVGVLSLSFFSCGSDDTVEEEELDPVVVIEEEIEDPETIHSTITFDNPGELIDTYYYDIKYLSRSVSTLSQALTIFKEDGLNGLRIPILGTSKSESHPSEGVVDGADYEQVITSINFAKAARGNEKTYVFASKKLEGQGSFPDWVKDEDGIIPAKYAILVADFIEYMNDNNVVIDYLGIDNEFVYNEGNITPQKYVETIIELKKLAVERSFEMPVLVGYEDFGPFKRNWVGNLKKIDGWEDTMDIYGTHYYPQFRPLTNLKKDLALVDDMPFWSTEPHWDAKSVVNDFDEAESGIVGLWDQIDVGMNGFMWWDLNYNNNNVRLSLMRAISTPLLGARPIHITDIDGEDTSELGKLQTRAFINDKTITVYAVNMNSTVREDYTFKVEGAVIDGGVSSIQWVEDGVIEGKSVLFDPTGVEDNFFIYTLPERSISRFTFTIK